MEAFYTLQGEGFHQGKAAYFIRLAGCDVGCVWCDVKESWNPVLHPHRKITELVLEARRHKGRIAVITGGEPLMHDCTALTHQLHQAGFNVHMETSGSSPLSGEWDWICLSPKKFKPPLPEVVQAAHELKVVIYHKSDFAWAEQWAAQVSSSCKLYLQPEWQRSETMLPLIVEYIKENPHWELSVQIHKFINVP
ncbi:MAG: 7-carboxy-7-deazaguanine synthase QueE [Williamsia sp.]|nr:7-carboxy-7-deazaguanine synthase QueE [Williamsia sp.]